MSTDEPKKPYVYQPLPANHPNYPRIYGVAGPGVPEHVIDKRFTREEADEILVVLSEKSYWPTPAQVQVEMITAVFTAVQIELGKAMAAWPPFNSAHEGFAVLQEEIDELWEHVRVKQKNRDLSAMQKEALQVAAMAMRFALEVCTEERGRK